MAHEHIPVMPDALLVVLVLDGFTSAYHRLHDTVIDTTCREVAVSTDSTVHRRLRHPAAYAHVSVDSSGDTYTVGVFGSHVASSATLPATSNAPATSSRSPPRATPWHPRSARSRASCDARSAAGDPRRRVPIPRPAPVQRKGVTADALCPPLRLPAQRSRLRPGVAADPHRHRDHHRTGPPGRDRHRRTGRLPPPHPEPDRGHRAQRRCDQRPGRGGIPAPCRRGPPVPRQHRRPPRAAPPAASPTTLR